MSFMSNNNKRKTNDFLHKIFKRKSCFIECFLTIPGNYKKRQKKIHTSLNKHLSIHISVLRSIDEYIRKYE